MKLNTGHNRLNVYMYSNMKLASSPTCNFSLEYQTAHMHCLDARFCRQQEQTCGQQQSSYTSNSTAARRNGRRRPLSSCRLDSECNGDGEEEEEEASHALVKPLVCRAMSGAALRTCWRWSPPLHLCANNQVVLSLSWLTAPVHPSVCPSVCLSVCLSVSLSHLSLPDSLSLSDSVYLSVCLCLSVSVSLCVSVSLSL